jgi:hypothetical protein
MTDGEDWRRGPQQGNGQQQYPQEQAWQPQQYDPGAHQRRLGGAPLQQQAPWPQGQQWQQPGYGQQQPFQSQPQYPAQPPWQGQQPRQGPRRRKRYLGRKIAGGIAGLVVVIIGIAVANSGGGHTVNTAGTTGTAATDGNPGASAAPKTAGIGSAITLAGNDNGEQMSVTLTKVIASATPASSGLDDASSGDLYYAAQFRLADTGSAAYSDSPSNGAEVVDSAGQSYDASITDTVNGCQSFAATENIAPGSSGLGCIVFEVPKSAKIVSVQFTLDSGMGPQTGQWNVR